VDLAYKMCVYESHGQTTGKASERKDQSRFFLLLTTSISPFNSDFRFVYILPDEAFAPFLVLLLLLLLRLRPRLRLRLTCIGNCMWKGFTFPQEQDS